APTPGVTAGVVFQQPRLFPWRTVGGNVDLALKYANVPRERRAEWRDQLLDRVGLDGTADRKIWEIRRPAAARRDRQGAGRRDAAISSRRALRGTRRAPPRR